MICAGMTSRGFRVETASSIQGPFDIFRFAHSRYIFFNSKLIVNRLLGAMVARWFSERYTKGCGFEPHGGRSCLCSVSSFAFLLSIMIDLLF